MKIFLFGALVATSVAISIFFLRFWRDSRDRFFLLFSLAFATLSVHWAVLAAIQAHAEWRPGAYLVRLAAFALILIAIADKNRR